MYSNEKMKKCCRKRKRSGLAQKKKRSQSGKMQHLHHLSFLILSIIIAFFTGAIVTGYQLQPPPAMAIIEDENADTVDVAVVTISGIENSALRGTVEGNVRLVARDQIIEPDAHGSFSISDSSLLTNRLIIDAPPGMHFVASKKGKKYYPIESSSGMRIVPANRVYFPDQASAEKAGFVR